MSTELSRAAVAAGAGSTAADGASSPPAAEPPATPPSGAGSRWERVAPVIWPPLLCYVIFTILWTGFGLVIKSGPVSAVRAFDARVAEELLRYRTPGRDDIAFYVAHSADTFVKIGATALLAGLFWLLWRRWKEALLVAGSLVLEAAVFLTVTTIVQRPRPDVPRLEDSPVGSSFPSGHTAAAAVYSALAVVLFWHTRHRLARTAAVVLSLTVPAGVGFARVYQGMHHVTDVAFGALLGFTTVLVVAHLVGRPEEPAERGAVEQ
jgi:membrane-associated phospholipid phosphatase